MQGGNQGMTPEQWQAYTASLQGYGAMPTMEQLQAMTPEQQQAYYASLQQTAGFAGGMSPQMGAMTPEQRNAMPQMGAMSADPWQAYAGGMQPMGGMQPAAGMQSTGGMQPMTAAPMLTPEQLQAMTPEQQQAYYATLQQMSGMSAIAPEQWQAYAAMQQNAQIPTAAPARSKAKKPKARRKRLSPVGKVFVFVLVAAIAGTAAWLIFVGGKTRPSTAVVQLGESGTSYTGDALIVRDETAFDDEGVLKVEYKAGEGDVVYRGTVVCYVYSTGYSSKEMDALQEYRDQIKDYQQTLLQSETAYDQKMQRLETNVVERGLEVRNLVQGARGNLSNQEKILADAIDERQQYFRSKYSDDMSLNRLYDDESTQSQRIESWIKQKAATQESIVSFYTDGFEYALTPTAYESYSPAEVRSMMNGAVPERTLASRGRTDIYRLVQKSNYVVLMLIKDNTWNPVEGDVYTLKLEQFSNTTVSARVISFTRASGELLVRLAVSGDVTPVLYMRTCQAELYENVYALMVPKEAVFEHNGILGVATPPVEEGRNSVFIPVTVLKEEGDVTYISPMQTGTLNEGDTVNLYY